MVSEGHDGVDGPWILSNAVQVSEPKNLIWTRVDQAIEQYRKTIELDPNFFAPHPVLGAAYVQKSMHKEGIAELEKAVEISPSNITF